MTSSFSNVDEYGFKRSEDFDYERYDKFMSSYLVILANRSKKWFNLMNHHQNKLKLSSKLKRYIQKGIPSIYRAQIWMMTSNVNELKRNYDVNLYRDRLNTILDSDIVQSIRIDIPRTFPENIYFAPSYGCQTQLYRVLYAFAADNREIGYCQGLNYIVGLLLLITKDEETSFWLLKVIIENIIPKYHVKNMRGLTVDIEVFATLVRTRMPDIHRHMKNLHIPWTILIIKWFVCLYAEVLPTETVLRIWDCMFYQRSKILFRVAFTLVSYHRKSLLACEDFTSFVNFFKKIPDDGFVLDCHNFMKKVNSENKFITNKELTKLRKQVKVVNE